MSAALSALKSVSSTQQHCTNPQKQSNSLDAEPSEITDAQASANVDEDDDDWETITGVPSDSSNEPFSARSLSSRLRTALVQVFFMQRSNEFYISTSVIFAVWSLLFHCLNLYVRPITLMQRSAAAPQRFFPLGSPIEDLYDGNDSEVFKILSRGEIVFVMYYAPWCAACMDARSEFDRVARAQSDQVKFLAINCWDPGGRCRHSYKMYTFPVFAIYPGRPQGVFYTGPIVADYIYKFIESVLSPLELLSNRRDFEEFIESAPNLAVIGYFENVREATAVGGYANFYMAALKALERDPARFAARFGVMIKRKLASHFGFNITVRHDVRIYARNGTNVSFPDGTKEFVSTAIVEWIFSTSVTAPVSWILPATRGRSDSLQQAMDGGLLLILVTPRLPLFRAETPTFALFRRVALAYKECVDEPRLSVTEREIADELDDWRMACRRVTDAEQRLSSRHEKECCPLEREAPVTCATSRNVSSPLCPNDDVERLRRRKRLRDDDGESETQICFDGTRKRLAEDDGCDRSCYGHVAASIVPSPPVVTASDRRLCARYRLGKVMSYDYRWLTAESARQTVLITERVRGLSCRANRTINFVALDGAHAGAFVTGLLGEGASLWGRANSSLIVVVDRENEVEHVLTEVDVTHVVELVEQLSSGSRPARYFRRSAQLSVSPPGDSIAIRAINGDEFDYMLNRSRKHLLVFYQSTSCGFCKAVYQVLLALARYFRGCHSFEIVSIDADANDLQWEHTVERYPSLILYPARRKENSVAFPRRLPVRLPSLVAFVLAHTDVRVRARVALSVCASSERCVARNRANVRRRLAELRREGRIERANVATYERLIRLIDESGATQEEVDVLAAIASVGEEEGVGDARAVLRACEKRTFERVRRIELQRRALESLLAVLSKR